MKIKISTSLFLYAFVIALFSIAFVVYADPTGPATLTQSNNQRFNASQYSAKTVQAQAGNVSSLTLSGVSVTQSWQGFFGNITGTRPLLHRAHHPHR